MSNPDHSCAGNGAASFTTSDLDGLAARDTITVQWDTVAGCEDQTVAVAGYSTAYLEFDAAEQQPLITASAPVPLGTSGSLTWTVPDGIHPACNIQIDVITGPVLPQVDTAHRYNKPAFELPGGNDLIAAGYAHDSDCAPATTTSTPPTTITVTVSDPLPPSESTSTTAAPSPPPTVTTTVELVGSPVPNPSGPGEPTIPYSAPSLPVTGAGMELGALGSVVLLAGLLAGAASRRLRRAER